MGEYVKLCGKINIDLVCILDDTHVGGHFYFDRRPHVDAWYRALASPSPETGTAAGPTCSLDVDDCHRENGSPCASHGGQTPQPCLPCKGTGFEYPPEARGRCANCGGSGMVGRQLTAAETSALEAASRYAGPKVGCGPAPEPVKPPAMTHGQTMTFAVDGTMCLDCQRPITDPGCIPAGRTPAAGTAPKGEK